MDTTTKIAWGLTLCALGTMAWMQKRKREQGALLYNPIYMENEKLPLGYRSNNPLNIRYNAANKWQGKMLPPAEGKYGYYERFKDLVYGYRAALVLLRNYIKNYGANTISKIITKWAPDSDHNYTDSYIANVSKLTGIHPDTVISRNNKDALTKIAYAMSICENGYKELGENGKDLKETYGLPNMDIINQAWGMM